MNKRLLLFLNIIFISSSGALYGMGKEQEECTKMVSTPCEEQQLWLTNFQNEYKKTYYIPINRETRKLKKMWKHLPLEEQKKLAKSLFKKKSIKAKTLNYHTSMTLFDAMRMKKNNWDRATLVPRAKNLVPRTIGKDTLNQALKTKIPSATDCAGMLLLLQISKVHSTRASGKKLLATMQWMQKNIVEQTALQSSQDIIIES